MMEGLGSAGCGVTGPWTESSPRRAFGLGLGVGSEAAGGGYSGISASVDSASLVYR